MIDNRGSKRTAPSDDDSDQNDESTSERNDSSRRSPIFQMPPGPASWKRSFHTEPYPIRNSLGSSSRKPGAVASKTTSAVDKKTAANSPEATFQRLKRESKASKIGIDNNRNEFIWLVRKFPHLYDRKDPFFRNATKKKEAWTAISVIVGMCAEDCQVRWKLLRDRYCRERKRLSQHIDPDFRDLMDKELKFLDSAIRPRRTIKFPKNQDSRASASSKHARKTEEENGEEEDEEEEDEEKEEEDGDDDDDAEVNGVQSRANGRPARRSIDPLNNAVPTLSGMKQSQDENQLFADTLTMFFRQCSPEDKTVLFAKYVRSFYKMQKKKIRP